MRVSRAWLAGTAWLLSGWAGAQTPAPPSPAEPSDLDRYQECFQKMIDAGSSDNAFMKRCLGLADKPAPKKGPNGEAAFLTKAQVAEVVQKGLPALTECYGKLLTQSKDLGLTPEGTVDPRFEVSPEGGVDAIAFDATSMSDVSLLSCVRGQIKAWTFPPTAFGDKLSVRLSLRMHVQTVKKAKVGVVTLAKDSPKLSAPGYGLSPEDILAVFRKNVPKVRQCYDELVKKTPGASGNAAVDLAVSATGKVTHVNYREFTIGDDGFKTCVTAQLRKWKFPRPRGGEATTVRYPAFTFAPHQ